MHSESKNLKDTSKTDDFPRLFTAQKYKTKSEQFFFNSLYQSYLKIGFENS